MTPHTASEVFLFVYALFALAVLGVLHVARRNLERGALPKVELRDPYLSACLNGGPKEVVRVAMIDLVDRGLLTVSGDTAHVADAAAAFVQRPVERMVLERFQGGASLRSAAGDASLHQ